MIPLAHCQRWQPPAGFKKLLENLRLAMGRGAKSSRVDSDSHHDDRDDAGVSFRREGCKRPAVHIQSGVHLTTTRYQSILLLYSVSVYDWKIEEN